MIRRAAVASQLLAIIAVAVNLLVNVVAKTKPKKQNNFK